MIESIALLAVLMGEPHAITFMRGARDAITSAQINWTMRLADGSVTPYEFRLGPAGDRVYARSRVAEDEDSLRYAGIGEYHAPMAWLLDEDGGVWKRDQNTANLEHYTLNDKNIALMELQDPRTIGDDYRIARTPQSKSIFDIITGYSAEETLPDGRISVTAELQSGQKMNWIINPDKGWNAEQLNFLDRDDDLISTVEVTLESYNGVWFPRKAETYEGKRRSFLAAVEVLPGSRINDPALPGDLTIAHLGADAGFAVRDWTKGMSDRLITDVWDGQQLIAPEEFRARLMDGSAKMGPEAERIRLLERERFEARLEGTRPADIPSFPDAWERYVQKFCEAYRLDSGQVRVANDVLEKCQRRAVKLLERDPALREELARLRAEKGKSREFFYLVRSFAANNTEKLKPVREIFENELKPRLFEIPTERQISDCGDPEKIKSREAKPAEEKRTR